MKLGVYNDRNHPLKVLTTERVKSYLKVMNEMEVELFFFEIDDVDIQSSEITGTFFEKGGWIQKATSFPDLILNESSTSLDKVKNKEKELKLKSEVPFISHLIGDKLRIYHLMKESNQFDDILIPSKPLNHVKNGIESSEKMLVLKPTNSGKGQGIHILKRVSGNRFLHISGEEKKQLHFLQVKKLLSELIKKGNYMVQPYIPSKTSDGHTFHMRVHLIRNHVAKWICLIVIADLAEPGRYTSNY